MENQDSTIKQAANLRRRAEQVLEEADVLLPEDNRFVPQETIRQLLHEQRIRQVELEMQNEALRRANLELDGLHARSFDLFNKAPAGYCTVSEQGLILEANLTAATLFDSNQGELTKTPIFPFIFPDDQECWDLYCKRLFETAAPHECDLRMLKRDGCVFWAHLSGTFEECESGARLARILFFDITARKDKELRLKEQLLDLQRWYTSMMNHDNHILELKQELERRVDERTREVIRQHAEIQELHSDLTHLSRISVLGQLTAALAHEINQPLGAILNRASSAQMLLAHSVPDILKVQQILSSIIDEDERAGAVIRGIREMCKKEPVKSESVDIDIVVRDIVTLLHVRNSLKAVDLTVDIEPGMKVVTGSKVQLQQVVLNLITNALEALSEVPVKKMNVRVDSCRAGVISVTVLNSGPQIATERLEQLFKPFHTTKEEGLGMGLFICRSIIEAHGGHLTAYNVPGEGVNFCFSVPSAKTPGWDK